MKYTKEILALASVNSRTYADVARQLHCKVNCGSVAYISRLIRKFGIDTKHFWGVRWRSNPELSQQYGPFSRKKPEDILILREGDPIRQRHAHLYRALIECGVKPKCAECGCGETWNGRKLVLQIDHINGNVLDDRIENLRFLCPNCHTQTENYCNNRRRPCSSCGRKISSKNKSGLCFECFVARKERIRHHRVCSDCGRKISPKSKGHCKRCSNKIKAFKSRRVKRPLKKTLLRKIARQGYESVGRYYGVSGNSIRKWLK